MGYTTWFPVFLKSFSTDTNVDHVWSGSAEKQ